MARLPRIVVPNQPLHIMHRGNNRQDIFESGKDMTRIKEDISVSLEDIGGRCRQYQALFDEQNGEREDAKITQTTMKGEVYGSEGFHERIGKLVKRVTKLGSHGGDRKSEEYKSS